ncbi:MAG: DNA/RNA helicase domain-containing protein [Asticcacaulis sp.]
MQSKRAIADFDMSEPEFLLNVMDRHADWCTVICLVGGGQEINTGEAGLSEWMAAIRHRFPHWRVHASDQIRQPDYDLNHDARDFIAGAQVTLNADLHLGVSMRSFRAETLSDFISHVLNGDAEQARAAHAQLDRYPLFLTRDLDRARQWPARDGARLGTVRACRLFRRPAPAAGRPAHQGRHRSAQLVPQ